ncbi:MAG: hypothetical protein HFJ40_03870 [Clostridia bacterium]|nr:hypothetical protein [Clostridia bacterium]
MMPRKKRITLLIVSVIVVIIIALSAFLILYLNTDMFKAKDKLFVKYIGGNIDNVDNMLRVFEKSQYDKTLDENKYITDTQIKVNYMEGIGTSLENTQNDINKLKINISGETDKTDMYDYKDIQLLNNDEKVFQVEYLKNEKTHGIKFSDLFKQYISTENTNLKELLKKSGYSDEDLENIPDEIEFDNEFETIFTEEEKQNIKTKYSNILISGISKDKFSKKSNVVVKIENKNIKTNVYTLTITKEQLNNIYLNILNELKQDEIILSKLDNIQKIMKPYKFLLSEDMKDIKESFISKIDDIIDTINKNNIGNDETKIIVYESGKETVRTTIQGVGYEISLDYLQLEGEKYIQLINKDTKQEIEKCNTYTLKDSNEEVSFNISNVNGDEKRNINIVQNEKIDGSNQTKNIVAKLENNSNKVEANIEKKFNIVENFDKKIELNKENSIKLDDLNEEQAKKILETVSNGVSDKINKLGENIKEEDILKVFETIGIVKREQKIEANGISKTEKTRFNSQFEIFKGQDLESDSILNLIETSKNNLIGMEVVSNTKLKLKLDRYNSNEKIQEKLTTFIKDDNNKRNKYNVEIEYNQETGLANYIILTIIKAK